MMPGGAVLGARNRRSGAVGTWREFDMAAMGPEVTYPLLNSIVVPRPIAWVSSRSATGIDNFAPHSFYTVSSVSPPVVQFTSVGTKDSLRNVRETGVFVVHLVSRALAEHCNLTSTDFPAHIDESVPAGLATEPARAIAASRLVDASVSLECRSVGEHSFGSSTVVFGEVVWITAAEAVLAEDGAVDVRLAAPVARLGRNDWAEVGELFSLRRVPYTEWAAR